MTRRILSREQTLKWNPDWSYNDCEVIEQNLDRLNPQSFYVPPSGGYVGCINADGTTVMFIHAGYVEFNREHAPSGLPEPEWAGLALSTFRPHASPTSAPIEGTQACPIHHIALPVTGICDDCQ